MKMIILQAAAGPGILGDPMLVFYIIAVFLVINFVILMPRQKKKEKEQRDYLDNLAKGAKVVTISGIHGTVAQTEDKTYLIEITPGVKVKMEKTALSYELTKAMNASSEDK